MTAAQTEAEWIDWAGGECPVPGEALVDLRFLGTSLCWETAEAGLWNWSHLGARGDIIAYRVVSQ